MKPILLALSTFRQPDILVRKTIQLAKREGRPLIVAFVIDENIDRYVYYTDVISAEHLETLERRKLSFLNECRRVAEEKTAVVAADARAEGVSCETIVVTGRFGIEIEKIIDERKPEKVTLTRSGRPARILQLFGSPVDHVIKHARCPVLVDHGLAESERGELPAPRSWLSALFSFGKKKKGMRGGFELIAVVLLLAAATILIVAVAL